MIKLFKKLSKPKHTPSYGDRTVVGFYEDVVLRGRIIRAKVDSGASTSSIDAGLADFLGLGPVHGSTTVISSHGRGVRPLLKADIEIGGRKLNAEFNIARRHNLRYPLLIGKNILRKGFVIDSAKKLKKRKISIIKNTKEFRNIENFGEI
jgi:hypothetical protein